MNKTGIIAIVVLGLIIIVGLLFINKETTVDLPVVDNSSKDMEDMKPTDVPSNYNAPVSNTTAPVKEFTVEGKNFSFSLKEIKVKKGDLVKINFKNTQGFHDLVIDEFKVATKQFQAPGTEVLEFIADKVGSFEYYCSVGSHRAMGMWGTLIVEELLVNKNI